MNPSPPDYGVPNRNAPRELSQFAFLIGTWRCESSVKGPDGEFHAYPATWVARYILDGYVIADEFRQLGPAGEVAQLGQNLRCFNSDKKAWVIQWLDALDGTWLELGPEDLGGVVVRGGTITYKHRRPRGRVGRLFPLNSLFRLTYEGISENHFTWRAELSTDGGESWAEVQVIEAHRVTHRPPARPPAPC